jgi:hypothetical protein
MGLRLDSRLELERVVEVASGPTVTGVNSSAPSLISTRSIVIEPLVSHVKATELAHQFHPLSLRNVIGEKHMGEWVGHVNSLLRTARVLDQFDVRVVLSR